MSRRDANTTKVFVGSLPEGVTTDDLRELFAPYGKIVECDIGNRCGFLHLEDKELALKSIEALNNTTLKGGKITVEQGRVKPPRRIREGSGVRGPKRERGGPYDRNNVDLRGPPRNKMGGYDDGGYDERGYGDRGFGGDRGYDDRGYGDRGYGGFADRGYVDRGYGGRGGGDELYSRDRYGEFDRQPPRGFGGGGGYDNVDDRRLRSYGNAPRGYPGYDRGTYDDRRVPPGGDYDGGRPIPGERRSLLASSNNMFSRRGESLLKPVPSPSPSGGYGDRNSYAGSGYDGGNASYNSGGNYGVQNDSGYGNTSASYNSAPNGAGYGSSSYGSSGPVGGGGGYNSGPVGGSSYGTSGPAGGNGYGSSTSAGGNAYGGGYNTSGDGYGDSYNSRPGGNYETSYPAPQQKGFASSGGGSGPRSASAGRRY